MLKNSGTYYNTIFLALVLLLTSTLYAQESQYDQIESISETLYLNSDSSLTLLNVYNNTAKKNSDIYALALICEKYGDYFEMQEELKKAQTYYKKSASYYIQVDSTSKLSSIYTNIGYSYNFLGENDSALIYFFNAEKIALQYNNQIDLQRIYQDIGLVYTDLYEYEKSLKYHRKSLNYLKNYTNKKLRLAELNQNIGIVYSKMTVLDSAIYYYNKSLKIFEELDDIEKIAITNNNLGVLFERKEVYDSSLHYYSRALTVFKDIDYKYGEAITLTNIALIEILVGEYDKATQLINESITLCHELGLINQLYTNYDGLARASNLRGDYKKAYEYLLQSNTWYDSISVNEQNQLIAELETEYETEKKEQQIALQKTRLEFKGKQTFGLTIILLLTSGLTIYVIYTSLNRRKANRLLAERNKLLNNKNTLITSSITYGSFIQNTILPDQELFNKTFKDSFILYKPKDIVSGDFYWLSKHEDEIIIAVADCTGHGVPGAFMSLLGVSFLNEITDIQDITQPDKILNKLREKVIGTLRQKDSDRFSRDGIELAICRINTKAKTIDYSGAYSPIILYSGDNKTELKPNKMPIGFHVTRKSKFSLQTINYKTGDQLYFFTDGYYDQFGGPNNKKYGQKRLKYLIETMHHLPMSEQLSTLKNSFENWIAIEEQIDDVTVVGIVL